MDPRRIASSFGGAKKHLGYVAQRDSPMKTITPREALYFSAKLRLSKHTTEHELAVIVQETLEELRLAPVADNCGSNLSGGEMRRVSLGVELVTNPGILLLDEVTSGELLWPHFILPADYEHVLNLPLAWKFVQASTVTVPPLSLTVADKSPGNRMSPS